MLSLLFSFCVNKYLPFVDREPHLLLFQSNNRKYISWGFLSQFWKQNKVFLIHSMLQTNHVLFFITSLISVPVLNLILRNFFFITNLCLLLCFDILIIFFQFCVMLFTLGLFIIGVQRGDIWVLAEDWLFWS
jgi:hypothetical protein